MKKYLEVFLILFLLSPFYVFGQETVYENAEDGLTTRWSIYDGSDIGVTISNVTDNDRGSEVIEFSGTNTLNGYALGSEKYLQNSSQFNAEWSMKYNEFFVVYFHVNTTAGEKYLSYSPTNDALIYWEDEEAIYGLGEDAMDGTWQTFNRDLEADVVNAFPGISLLEVWDFKIRGSGRVDDIKLKSIGVLPVELTLFSAIVNEEKVQLNWETTTEVNNYGFEILRFNMNDNNSEERIDQKSWINIGFVNGNGNSNSPKYYSFTDKEKLNGKYSYKLKQIDIDGKFKFSKTVEISFVISQKFELHQNYPNPFNPTTSVSYSIPGNNYVTLKIYDILGNEIIELENGYKTAGFYTIIFDATNYSSGIYFYTLKMNNYYITKRMQLIK